MGNNLRIAAPTLARTPVWVCIAFPLVLVRRTWRAAWRPAHREGAGGASLRVGGRNGGESLLGGAAGGRTGRAVVLRSADKAPPPPRQRFEIERLGEDLH